MARRPRLQFPGAIYHVMSRGNRKSTIFLTEADRRHFLNVLGETSLEYGVRVYAACPMGTHYHAVIDTPRGNLSHAMRQLNGVYSQDFNLKYQCIGHTFQGRFQSIVVQRERYLKRAIRYIALNPVKAGLCKDPTEWLCSTHRATAGLEPCPGWLYLDWIDWAFKSNARGEAQERYRKYVEAGDPKFQINTRAFVFGSKRFEQSVLALVLESPEDRSIPRFCRGEPRPPLTELFAVVNGDPQRRNEMIVVAHETHGYRLTELASFLGLKASSVSKARRRAKNGGRLKPPK